MNKFLERDNVLRCYTNLNTSKSKVGVMETVCYFNGKPYTRKLGHYNERSALNSIVSFLNTRGYTIDNIDYRDIGIG